MARPWRSVLALLGIAAVAVVLLANPLYLHPDGGGHYEATYHVEAIENDSTARQAIGLSERPLECPGQRACALEERILDDGPIESDHRVAPDDRRYPVVAIHDGLYRPEERRAEESTVLALEEVSPQEAAAVAAVPVSDLGRDVRRAVETGSVTVYGEQVEAFERGEIVSHDGTLYYRDRYELRGGHWTGGVGLLAARAILLAIGGGLLAYAGWRYRDLDA